MRDINVLSLFDGISGGMLVLDRLGVKVNTYFASEIDSAALSISKYNYPNIIQLGDITGLQEERLRLLPKIDLIFAGSPCQGFSKQGTQMNFNHPESKLFFDFIRVLEWIRMNNNPEVWFFLENVEMKKEWRDVITSYVKVAPLLINSKLSSAQNRPRNYWSNLSIISPVDKNIILKDVLDTFDTNNLIGYKGLLVDKDFSGMELELIDVVDGEVRIKQATKLGYIVAEDGDGVNLAFPSSKTRRGRVIRQKSNTLDRSCNACVYYDGIIRRLQICELEKLQTLPVGYTGCVKDTDRKAAIGNGWNIDTIVDLLGESEIVR